MKVVKQTYNINAPVDKVWDALVNPNLIEKWGGGPAEMNDREGSEFKLWGGDIYGKNTKVIKNKKLVQEWIERDWDKPSIVTFNLSYSDGKTIVELTHTDIPDNQAKDIEDGWRNYYMVPLKELVESS